MKRDLGHHLAAWKISTTRMPLMLRGARQTGKTHLVRQFAETCFDTLVEVNLEQHPEYKGCFDKLDPFLICQKIELLSGSRITPGSTLLFIDEIQESSDAIRSLRYFKESYPELHVISAGSLLEFAFDSADFSMPVGRVSYLHLRPLNFVEFLNACGETLLVDWMESISLGEEISEPIHLKCIALFKTYMAIGGMPAVVSEYVRSHEIHNIRELQANILNTYQQDFGKYASRINQGYCEKIFNKAPAMMAKHFRYRDVDLDVQARSLKTALRSMMQAGIIFPVYQNTASGLPLNAHFIEKKFKLLFLDGGLAQAAMRLDLHLLIENDNSKLLTHYGQLMEQMVGQELLAYQEKYMMPELFFWMRDKRGSQAEVDYLYQYRDHILPIEVKSGATGRLKSMQLFIDAAAVPMGIKTSMDKLYITKDKRILSIPVYLLSQLDRLIGQV